MTSGIGILGQNNLRTRLGATLPSAHIISCFYVSLPLSLCVLLVVGILTMMIPPLCCLWASVGRGTFRPGILFFKRLHVKLELNVQFCLQDTS